MKELNNVLRVLNVLNCFSFTALEPMMIWHQKNIPHLRRPLHPHFQFHPAPPPPPPPQAPPPPTHTHMVDLPLFYAVVLVFFLRPCAIRSGAFVCCFFFCFFFRVLSFSLPYSCVKWILSSTVINLLGKRELVDLLFFGLWFVYCVLVCLLFLSMSLVGNVLWLWLFLEIFYTIFLWVYI